MGLRKFTVIHGAELDRVQLELKAILDEIVRKIEELEKRITI